MRKIYLAFFTSLLVIASLTGCKLDPPVYPSGTGTTGTTAGNTITLKIGNNTLTYTNDSFIVFPPGSQGAILSPTTGQTTISGLGASQTDVFTLSFLDSKPGTYDIVGVIAGNYTNDPAGKGTVNVTTLSYANFRGTLQGTFTVDMIDAQGKAYPNVSGSFYIKM